MEKKFSEARQVLKGMKAFRMCFSHSVTIAKYPHDYTDRLIQWQQWHQSWVYDVAPNVDMRSSMPLPPLMQRNLREGGQVVAVHDEGNANYMNGDSSGAEFLNESTDDENIGNPPNKYDSKNPSEYPEGPSDLCKDKEGISVSSGFDEGYDGSTDEDA